MDDLSDKIDLDYFHSCCKVAAANTKGKGRLAFLMHVSVWVHDRTCKEPFRPNFYSGELDKQYIEAIVKLVEESKVGDYDARAVLMEYLETLSHGRDKL